MNPVMIFFSGKDFTYHEEFFIFCFVTCLLHFLIWVAYYVYKYNIHDLLLKKKKRIE